MIQETPTTIVVGVLVIGVIAGTSLAVATPGMTTVTMTTEQSTITTDETTTATLAVANASEGVGAGNVTITVSDAETARIQEVSFVNSPGIEDVRISEDGSTAHVEFAVAQQDGDGSIPMIEVTLAGVSSGSTSVNATVHTLSDLSGEKYAISTVSAANLVVEEPTTTTTEISSTESSQSTTGGGPGSDTGSSPQTSNQEQTVSSTTSSSGGSAVPGFSTGIAVIALLIGIGALSGRRHGN